jgi:hypothetical protein
VRQAGWDTFTLIENNARQRVLSQDNETHSYSTFGHALSYGAEFRALSFLGIQIFNF